MRAIILLLFFISGSVLSQEINQFDAQGKRHGKWKKFFKGTKKVRYSGQFEHGKEVGVFKFYHKEPKGKHPSLIKTFTLDSNIAEVKYYTSTGTLISEGQLKEKARIGKWIVYHKNSTVISEVEFYKDGKLDGKRTSYYKDGMVLQVEHYENGVLHGKKQIFDHDANLIKELNYTNGVIDGYFTEYRSGKETLVGKYQMGKPRGIWKYYKKGKLVETKDYTKTNNPKYKKK